MNVLFELETDGDEFIWIHELKLSDETWNVPEQDVFDEFVVTNVVSIDSENVTEIDVLVETEVSPLDGEVKETVGGVVSVEVVTPVRVFDVSLLFLGVQEVPLSDEV